MRNPLATVLLTTLGVSLLGHPLMADDWPQWRHDAARSATSEDVLPDELHLLWMRQLPAPRPAWPASQPSLRFDVSYSPVAAGKMLFVPSMVTDTVTAYDTETGEQRWQFFAEGPIRFAPVFHDGKVYAGSDDGYLYCLDAAKGTLLWKVRGGPTDRRIIGNERLISTWPVRGGPVLEDGVVYFTAGIWPFMGIFVHAVDAETGEPVWTNSGDSITYQINPHGAPSFGGFVPRGHLAITDEGLLAPGGRTPPGLYSLKTGRLMQFEFSGKGGRSVHQPATITVGGRKFQPGTGKITGESFEAKVDGNVWGLLAADGKLFAVTDTGNLYCFGANGGEPKAHDTPNLDQVLDGHWKRQAQSILRLAQADAGYGLVFGIGTGDLIEELVRNSNLHVIAIDPDPVKTDAFRRKMVAAGLYGTRVAALVGDPASCSLPPYLANVVASGDLTVGQDKGVAFIKNVFRTLRPYGGTACLQINAAKLAGPVKEAKLENATLKAADDNWSLLIREGALPGAADWTHNYADAGNSAVSKDSRARTPLGLLWFGGPSNDEVLPRHGHGPSPQVAGGRLVIEGANMLRAIDIYTGRLLWQRELPGLGTFYNQTNHQPGAGEIGSNYVTLPDSVYVIHGDALLQLDAATGETKNQATLAANAANPKPNWGSIAAWEDYLIATSEPVSIKDAGPTPSLKRAPALAGFAPLIRRHETWQYLADGRDAPNGWTAADFDAKGWKTGPGGFGYGDGDDRTLLDMKDKYSRLYIRKTFDGDAVTDAKEMALSISYDDGFIAYLNGKEVARSHVKGSGETAKAIGHEAGKFESFTIEDFRSLLRSGTNVIAIEGHNHSVDSSDFSLDPIVLVKPGVVRPKPEPEESGFARFFSPAKYSSASRRLVVMDRNTGKKLWHRDAVYGFRHNNIAVGAGKIFCIDGLSAAKLEAMERRGFSRDDYCPKLLALYVQTGEVAWATDENVFGTFLNYSTEHDVLLQAGSKSRDRARDEVGTGMVAYRGHDGKVLWQDLARSYSGPCILHKDSIIAQGPAYSLLTGEPKMRSHPLTGAEMEWQYTRNYGCNTAIAGQNVITFRSGAAGFYDLENDGGTGNFGGFKSSCTSNLIVAGGLLNAPEYTRTCTCNYQNQTSLALVHDPDAEFWTFNSFPWGGAPVRRVGINFGAPGDRRVGRGTLWLDFPSEGGTSPDIPVEVQGNVEYFRHHGSTVATDAEGEYGWVAASGVEGATDITLTLAVDTTPHKYTVRLQFAEVDRNATPGSRVFDVKIQGKDVLEDFDVVKEAGAVNRAVVKEFTGVVVPGKLTISMVSKTGTSILSGIEVVMER